MSDELMLWHPDYELGVDYIDGAHRELFLVFSRFQAVIEERHDGQRKALCDALLRYLTRYASKHFADEEAFMLKTEYAGYKVHKQLHDDLKQHTLPHLVKMLEEQKYSDDAINRFSGVLSTWLAGHILLEDHAIFGKIESRWSNDDVGHDMASRIDKEFRLFADDLFGLKFDLVNRHYDGEYLGEGNYSFYGTVKGGAATYKAVLICDGEFMAYVLKHISNYQCDEINAGTLEAFGMLAQSWIKAAVGIMEKTKTVELLEATTSDNSEYSGFISASQLEQSLLWKCRKHQVAMAIRKSE